MIVDTDILIDAGRGDSTAIGCLERSEQHSMLVVSVVTQMELLVGCRNKTEVRELEKFLQRFRIFKLTDRISDRAVELLQQYRLSHGLLIADALIAATSLEYSEPLISKNQSDYRFVVGLNLLSYP
jgi:predicted nucleic acid-binding protein